MTDVRDYLVTVLNELGFDASADTRTDFDTVFNAVGANTIAINAWDWFAAKLSPGDFLAPMECDQNEGDDKLLRSGVRRAGCRGPGPPGHGSRRVLRQMGSGGSDDRRRCNLGAAVQ